MNFDLAVSQLKTLFWIVKVEGLLWADGKTTDNLTWFVNYV